MSLTNLHSPRFNGYRQCVVTTKVINETSVNSNTQEQLIAAVRHAQKNTPVEYIGQHYSTKPAQLREVRMRGRLTIY